MCRGTRNRTPAHDGRRLLCSPLGQLCLLPSSLNYLKSKVGTCMSKMSPPLPPSLAKSQELFGGRRLRGARGGGEERVRFRKALGEVACAQSCLAGTLSSLSDS